MATITADLKTKGLVRGKGIAAVSFHEVSRMG
jgi:hypothetical protein